MLNRIKDIININRNKFNEDNYSVEHINLDGVDVELNIHKTQSKSVVILYPGADGSIDGYNRKYIKLANMLQAKNIATVIRIDNKYCSVNLPYIETMLVKLAYVIEHIYDNAEVLTGSKEIELSLAGVSAGAGAVATILEEFNNIKKVLLIAPADSVNLENIARGLKKYSGELYLVAGEDDEIGTGEVARHCFNLSESAKNKQIEIISGCDHQFTGKKNGQILSNAFLWAFANSGRFPSHRGGVVLYK